MRQQMHTNAANERRNSRAQLLLQHQQNQFKQNIYIPGGRNPSICSNFHLAPGYAAHQIQHLPKELREGSFAKQSTPILFLTNQGLHLRTLNAGQEGGAFNVRSCDLERWNSKRAPVLNKKEGLPNIMNASKSAEGLPANAQNLFEMQQMNTNFSRNRHLHNYHNDNNNNNNDNNNNNNNYNNGLQKRTCVLL